MYVVSKNTIWLADISESLLGSIHRGNGNVRYSSESSDNVSFYIMISICLHYRYRVCFHDSFIELLCGHFSMLWWDLSCQNASWLQIYWQAWGLLLFFVGWSLVLYAWNLTPLPFYLRLTDFQRTGLQNELLSYPVSADLHCFTWISIIFLAIPNGIQDSFH